MKIRIFSNQFKLATILRKLLGSSSKLRQLFIKEYENILVPWC